MPIASGPALPTIRRDEDFDDLVRKLAAFFVEAVHSPHDWEELRRFIYARSLKPLVQYLVNDIHHPAVASALLALKWHFTEAEDDDDRGINNTRGLACEIVAWRFITNLTESEVIDHLCYELPEKSLKGNADGRAKSPTSGGDETAVPHERSPLIDGTEETLPDEDDEDSSHPTDLSFSSNFAGLNALEIAAISGAKRFFSQKAIQRNIDGIWKGDIIFWDTLTAKSTKQAKSYNRQKSDPFCRLRVPLYLKVFEMLFFAAFLALYYVVLVEKSDNITVAEAMLYIWLVSFAYNELADYADAGLTFYITDFWTLWDLAIIATGVAFFITRMIGIARADLETTDTAFDILAVEALFLVPRLFSLLSLHPYFGMLLPAMKEMTKDFIKFISFVAILYIGFDTCFTFLARGSYSLAKMNWILIKVFFGSGYLGFDIADEISPVLGPPLMFIFVCLTNILLITSLISLMSNSLTKVMDHSRDEYLFGYAVFVLESATSNRLTYFLPPLNLIPLALRPLRLVLSTEDLRSLKILLLKATHWPVVGLILGYESWRLRKDNRGSDRSHGRFIRGTASATSFRRPLHLPAGQRHRLAVHSSSTPLVEQTRAESISSNVPLRTALETAELSSAVLQLKAQLEDISDLLAKQKGANGKS